MKTRAIILAGGEGSRLGVLTAKRTKPAVPFAGKYRIMDFTLSNCVNSDIFDVMIMAQYRPHSLIEHIGSGVPWDLNRNFTGGVGILTPYKARGSSEWYLGTADSVQQNFLFIKRGSPDNILVLSGDHIYKMNYRDMLERHAETQADLTLATIRVPMDEAPRFGILDMDADHRVTSFVEKPAQPPSNQANMGVYLFNTKVLDRALWEDHLQRESSHDFGRDILPRMVAEGLRVYAYPFDGYWVDVGTVASYWKAHMDLLVTPPPIDLNDRSWIVHTRTEERPPVWIASSTTIQDSMITDGCEIYPGAQVIRSVLSPGVRVAEGAVVKESVILTDSFVQQGAVVERAILDKKTTIHEGAYVGGISPGKETLIAMIGKNSRILPGMVVEPGAVVGTDVIESDYPDPKRVRTSDYIQTKRLSYEIWERLAGILLHPTSLPGPYGIGDLGLQAHRWLDFLAQAGCSLWQVLPLGPTGYGDSPYQCFSAFAGNPYLVSPQALLEAGLLVEQDLEDMPDFPDERVDFGRVIVWKLSLLDQAYERFKNLVDSDLADRFQRFQAEQATWLEDFALFMALKDAHGGEPWSKWETPLRDRQPQALAAARQKLAIAIERQEFRQFLFFSQWQALRQHARQKGIMLIGDMPIFVAHDSADVWEHPELFFLDPQGRPAAVAGVPPDYFSPTGQLWGNPLYRWQAHKASGYAWWIARVRSGLGLVDLLRLDHFRGFAGYWRVPGRAKTAEKGRWVWAPGMDFLSKLQVALGELPIIAEDLGVITPDVVKLRETFGLPGMKILQFAFGGNPKDAFLPHNYPVHCVVYTGTHDNDTVCGWYARIGEDEKSFYQRYLARPGQEVAWDLIRACWSSVAVYALAPMQDFLSLGNQARMNYPGNPSGNWTWRMAERALNEGLAGRIRELNYLYDRLNPGGEDH